MAGGDIDKAVGVAISISTVTQGDPEDEWAGYSCLEVQRLEGSQLPAGCVDFKECGARATRDSPGQGVVVAVAGRQPFADVDAGADLRDPLRASRAGSGEAR